MKITSSAGALSKSESETIFPRVSGSEKSGASVPSDNIVLTVATIVLYPFQKSKEAAELPFALFLPAGQPPSTNLCRSSSLAKKESVPDWGMSACTKRGRRKDERGKTVGFPPSAFSLQPSENPPGVGRRFRGELLDAARRAVRARQAAVCAASAGSFRCLPRKGSGVR